MTTSRHYRSRSGFTLTELLVAMTVIAILIGMLAAAVVPAMAASKRTAILMEMKQIEQSIESFKTQYGIYPPSWLNIQTNDTTGLPNNPTECATELLRYVNRISRNNQEGALVSPGVRNIDVWWAAVGANINYGEGQDLVFWLSGLAKNKQFPLTNGGLVAYDDGGAIQRDVFYEFKSPQLVIDGNVAGYEQAADSQSPFLYIDAKTYGIDPLLSNGNLNDDWMAFEAYHVRNAVDPNPSNHFNSYENPNSFQLICFGLDKLAFDREQFDPALNGGVAPLYPTRWTTQTSTGLNSAPGFGLGADKFSSDNLCNFVDGMLNRYLGGAFDSPAVK